MPRVRVKKPLPEAVTNIVYLTGRAASAVLSRPGAVGKLLAIAAKSPDVDLFADSMVAALGSTTLLETASLDEMKLLLEQVTRELGLVATHVLLG